MNKLLWQNCHSFFNIYNQVERLDLSFDAILVRFKKSGSKTIGELIELCTAFVYLDRNYFPHACFDLF